MIKRESYLSRIRPFVDKEVIKVLTGVRRSGKSVMLEQIQKELINRGVSVSNIISLNFEDMRYGNLNTAETLNKYILERVADIKGKTYLFFDEIQEVSGWEKCINSLRASCDCDIYITGSNAKLLSGELATYLAGRYVEFTIYPFSFNEFMQLYCGIFPNANSQEVFSKYMIYGGMPYLGNLNYEDAPSRIYLQDLFNSVVLKDVVKRNSVRDVDLLERIIAYVMVSFGKTFTASSISKYFRSEGRIVAPETIMNYINYCMEAFLFYRAGRYDLQGKKVLTINEKYYIADHGLREAVYGGNMRDVHIILENVIFMELIRRGYKITVGKYGDKEIDFIGQQGSSKLYIQVSYLLASEDTIEREFGVFKYVQDNFPKYVVSLDEINLSQNGVKHVNIRDFLLASSWE